MAARLEMKALKAKKKALIAESEVCRELLKLEVQNLRIYGLKTKRRLTSFNSGNPLFMLAGLPMAGALFRRKRPRTGWTQWLALVVGAWQAYVRFGPAVRSIFPRRRAVLPSKPHPPLPQTEERYAAANF
jgi:hypothetical protein